MDRRAARIEALEAFVSEIERYGLWTTDLQRVKPYFDDAQLDLPGFGE